MEYIYLYNNKFSALNPRMFSHLKNLKYLWLENNTCIDKNYYSVPSMVEVEKELASCGVGYSVREPIQAILDRHDKRFESLENQLITINGKFESIEGMISEKFASLQNQLEERAKKVDRELEQVSELFAYVYQGNKQNAAEIKKVNEKVDKILEMLTSK